MIPGRSRFLTLLQGWDLTEDQIREQIRISEQSGTIGYLLLLTKLDQSWEPRGMRLGE